MHLARSILFECLIVSSRPISFMLVEAVERVVISEFDHMAVTLYLGDYGCRSNERIRLVPADDALLKKVFPRGAKRAVKKNERMLRRHFKTRECGRHGEMERFRKSALVYYS